MNSDRFMVALSIGLDFIQSPFRCFSTQICYFVIDHAASAYLTIVDYNSYWVSWILCSLYFWVCLWSCIHVILLMRIVVLNRHSKDLIKVSRLTQQLLVNLASFSKSPTHDLSIFLLYCITPELGMFLPWKKLALFQILWITYL